MMKFRILLLLVVVSANTLSLFQFRTISFNSDLGVVITARTAISASATMSGATQMQRVAARAQSYKQRHQVPVELRAEAWSYDVGQQYAIQA